MTEIRNSVLAGLAFGLFFGLFLALLYDSKLALIAGAFSGLAFGVIIYFFTTSKTVKKQTQIKNTDGNVVIRSAGANHFMKGEAVGGKLYLLTDKLHFKSHGFNIQNHALVIDLNQIKAVSFYNSLGFIPNGLAITKHDGQTEKFVVNGRRTWKAEIEKLM